MNESTTTALFALILFVIMFSVSQADDILRLLPKNNDVSGWVRKEEPKIYKQSQLWEYINGGADVYLDFGFVQVAMVELAKEKSSIIIDLYQMKNSEGAFGIYARERAPSYRYMKIGTEGYLEGVALNFCKSKYYVKLTAFSDDAQTKKALSDIAEMIAKRIGGANELPGFVKIFPERGKQKHTETYEIKSFLGMTELRETWTAKYIINGKKLTAFLSESQTGDAALSRLQKIGSKLKATGRSVDEYTGLGDRVISGEHQETGDIVMVMKGRYLFGLYPSSDERVTRELLRMILDRLK